MMVDKRRLLCYHKVDKRSLEKEGIRHMNEMISLSNGEWKIMKLLWQYETMTVGQIVTAVEGDTDWSKNTVFTMLKRLEEKGAVRMLSAKRPQPYTAIISKQQAVLEETGSFLSRVYDGSVGLFVSALSGYRGLSQKEIDELRAILDQAEEENRKREHEQC